MPNILAVLVAPASTAMVTLAQAKAAVGIASGDTSQDARLTDLIDAASDWFAQTIGRPIALQTVTEGFPTFNRLRLSLGLRPLVSVSAVRIDGATLDPSDYAIESKAAAMLWRTSGWGGDRGRVPSGISQDFWVERGERLVEVDYRAGWAMAGVTPGAGESALPPRLRQAALTLIAGWFSATKIGNDPRATSIRIGDYSATYVAGEAPDEVRQAAAAYADPIAAW
jgi:hypothetical protein